MNPEDNTIIIQAGHRAKVYKHKGFWWCHSYHIHITGIIRRISIKEYVTHDAALRAAVKSVHLTSHHYEGS